MKKCNIYLNFINSDSFDENNSDFKDILKHTENCVDCSYDRKVREQILECLANQPSPSIPENLHEFNLNSLTEKKESIIDTKLSNLFLNLLKPLEIAVPSACVLMLFFMIQINSSNEYELSQVKQSETNPMQKIRIAEANDNIFSEGLQKVSAEEVEEFLVKLDEFQRMHPESKPVTMKTYRPDIRLVGSRD